MKSIDRLACAGAVLLAVSATGAAAAAKEKVLSPGQVGGLMKKAKFQVSGVYRKGPSYVVRAKGPSGNDVILAVDGKSGKIIGLDVVKWAPEAKRVKRGSRGKQFTGDVYEFGVSISLPALATWVVYDPVVWTSTSDTWIEVETTTVTWTEVTYEESVTEVSYETYSQEYAEDYGSSLEEEVASYETAQDTIEETVTETTEVTETTTTTEETVSTTEETNGADDDDDGPAEMDDGPDDGPDDDGGADDSAGDDGGDDDPGR